MGLFDWVFGRKKGGESRTTPPRVISGLDDGSQQVVLDVGNGAVMVMDREQFDYQYGESDAPDPAQSDLDELLPSVTRVRAFACGMSRGVTMGTEFVLDTSEPKALSEFRQTLRISEDPATFSHCGCPGGPTLELYSGEALAATIGLQHGTSIRWAKWKHDAQLRNGAHLNSWLTQNGIDGDFLDVLLHNQYDAGGTMPLGFRKGGSDPLSRSEQRIRLAEIGRVRGGDLKEALAVCQKVLDEEPDLAYAHAVRAMIRMEEQDFDACVAGCTEAIRLGLRAAELFFTRSAAHECLGQSHEALSDCTSALELAPEQAHVRTKRAGILTKLERFEEALADLDEVIRVAPDWGVPRVNRAWLYDQRGDVDLAIAELDGVIEELDESLVTDDPDFAAIAYWNRAQCHRSKGDQLRAEADAREAVRLDPGIASEQGDPGE